MIIKSMSRKAATFGQLIEYITTGQIDERYNVHQNTFSRHYDKLKVERARIWCLRVCMMIRTTT